MVAKKATPKPAAPVVLTGAIACVICDKEYTNRRMGTGSPYEGKPVCTGCLPKALAEEKAAKAKAAEEAAQ